MYPDPWKNMSRGQGCKMFSIMGRKPTPNKHLEDLSGNPNSSSVHLIIYFKIRYNHPHTPILLVGTKLDLAGRNEEIRKARQMGKGIVTFRQVSMMLNLLQVIIISLLLGAWGC